MGSLRSWGVPAVRAISELCSIHAVGVHISIYSCEAVLAPMKGLYPGIASGRPQIGCQKEIDPVSPVVQLLWKQKDHLNPGVGVLT